MKFCKTEHTNTFKCQRQSKNEFYLNTIRKGDNQQKVEESSQEQAHPQCSLVLTKLYAWIIWDHLENTISTAKLVKNFD